MRKLLMSTLVSLLWVVPAMAHFAREKGKPPVAQHQAAPTPKSKPDQQQNGMKLSQPIEQSLRNQLGGAGFTDIEMIPLSFAVRAKDADGNAVWLMLSADGILQGQIGPQDGHDKSPTKFPDQQSF